MQKYVALFYLVLSVTIAHANDVVRVTSGEHDEFTRVVVYLPELSRWTVTQSGPNVIFEDPTVTTGFDTSKFFSRISKNRILEIETGNSFFSLLLGCECSTSVVEYSGMTVIDIYLIESKEFNDGRNTLSTKPSIRKFFHNARDLLPVFNDHRMLGNHKREKSVNENFNFLVQLLPLDGLSNQAFLQVDDEIFESDDDPRNILGQNNSRREMDSNISVSSSSEAFSENTIRSCIHDSGLNPVTWYAEKETSEGVFRLPVQAGLDYSEKAVASSYMVHLKHLLFFGLGAEARNFIAANKERIKDKDVFLGISNILEFGKTEDPEIIFGSTPCGPYGEFWAFLSSDGTNVSYDSDSIFRVFASLPFHLRSLLLPILINRFSQAGDKQNENYAKSIFTNSHLPVNIEILNTNNSHYIHSTQQLAVDLLRNSPMAPMVIAQDLVEILNSSIRNSNEISLDSSEAIKLFLSMSEGHNVIDNLDLALMNLLVFSNQYRNFVSSFTTFSADPSEKIELVSNFAVSLANNSDDLTFSEVSFDFILQNKNLLNLSGALEVSKRLHSLGFSVSAADILETFEPNEIASSDPIFLSRILASAGAFEDAASVIGEVNSQAAKQQLFSIRMLQQNYTEALSIALDIEDSNLIREASVFLGDVDASIPSTSNSGDSGSIDSLELPSDSPDILARSAQLVSNSLRLRNRVMEMTD